MAWIEHSGSRWNPVLRFAIYLENERGQRYFDDRTGEVAMTTVDAPLIGDLPTWWRPARSSATTEHRITP